MSDFVRSRNTEDAGNPIVGGLYWPLGADYSDVGERRTTTLHPAHGSRLTTVDVHRRHTTQHRRHFQTGAIIVSREPPPTTKAQSQTRTQ